MLGTRPILIPLSVLLSVSHSLRTSVISPFSENTSVGKGVSPEESHKRARARSCTRVHRSALAEIGKQWKFHRYLHISGSVRPPIFINELGYCEARNFSICPVDHPGNSFGVNTRKRWKTFVRWICHCLWLTLVFKDRQMNGAWIFQNEMGQIVWLFEHEVLGEMIAFRNMLRTNEKYLINM